MIIIILSVSLPWIWFIDRILRCSPILQAIGRHEYASLADCFTVESSVMSFCLPWTWFNDWLLVCRVRCIALYLAISRLYTPCIPVSLSDHSQSVRYGSVHTDRRSSGSKHKADYSTQCFTYLVHTSQYMTRWQKLVKAPTSHHLQRGKERKSNKERQTRGLVIFWDSFAAEFASSSGQGRRRYLRPQSQGHHTFDSWRWAAWKEELLDDLPLKDKNGPSAIRPKLELFQR